jgi:hypothetical protein
MAFYYILETVNIIKNIVTLKNRIPIDFDDDFFYFAMIDSGRQFTAPQCYAIN